MEWTKNKKKAWEHVYQYPLNKLPEVCKDFLGDPEIVLQAVSRSEFQNLQYASPALLDDNGFAMSILGQIDSTRAYEGFQYFSVRIRADKEIILTGLQIKPFGKSDNEILLKKCRSEIMCDVPKEYLEERDFMIKAVKVNHYTYRQASVELKEDLTLLLEACKQDPICVHWASPDLKRKVDTAEPVKFLEAKILVDKFQASMKQKEPTKTFSRTKI